MHHYWLVTSLKCSFESFFFVCADTWIEYAVVHEQSGHVCEVNTGNVIEDELLTWDLEMLSQNNYIVLEDYIVGKHAIT